MCNSFETLRQSISAQNQDQENDPRAGNRIEEQLSEAKGKWKPYRAHSCGKCDCQELKQLFRGIAYSMFYHIGAPSKAQQPKSAFSTIRPQETFSSSFASFSATLGAALSRSRSVVVPDEAEEKSENEKMIDEFCELSDIMSRRSYADTQKKRLTKLPEVDEIKDFLERMYSETKIFKEILVCAYILLERLVEETKCTLTPTTWRVMLIHAVHLALKMETDKYIPIQKLRVIYPLLKTSRYREHEVLFLKMIDYRCTVSSEDYFRTIGKLLRNGRLYHISKPGGSSSTVSEVTPFARRDNKLNTIAQSG